MGIKFLASQLKHPLTTSRVLTPSNFRLSYTPNFFRVSAAIGTVLFTGLEMMFKIAWQ
jgi:hypothetical protein